MKPLPSFSQWKSWPEPSVIARSKSGAGIFASCTQEILRWAEILSPKIDMDARLAIDTVVLLAYFVGIVALGLWAGRRNRNLDEFTLGSRPIPWWAVLAAIIAAYTSAATYRGAPAEGFQPRRYFFGHLATGTVLDR